jgi:hypothetical protein
MWNVEWTDLHAILAPGTDILVYINYSILQFFYCPGWTDLFAGCIRAVKALLFSEKPPRVFIKIFRLGVLNECPCLSRKVGRILVTSGKPGFFSRKLVPLLAGYLASTASYAFGSIEHHCKFSHLI